MEDIQVRDDDFGIAKERVGYSWGWDGLVTGRNTPRSEYYTVAPGTVINGPTPVVLDKATGTLKALAVDGQNAPNGPLVGVYPRSISVPADGEAQSVTVIHSCRFNFPQLKVPAALNTRPLFAAFLAAQGANDLIGLDETGGVVIDPNR